MQQELGILLNWLKRAEFGAPDKPQYALQVFAEKTLDRHDCPRGDRFFTADEIYDGELTAAERKKPQVSARIMNNCYRWFETRTREYEDFVMAHEGNEKIILTKVPGGGAGKKTQYILDVGPLQSQSEDGERTLEDPSNIQTIPNLAIQYEKVEFDKIKLNKYGSRIFRKGFVVYSPYSLFNHKFSVLPIILSMSIVMTIPIVYLLVSGNRPFSAMDSGLILASILGFACLYSVGKYRSKFYHRKFDLIDPNFVNWEEPSTQIEIVKTQPGKSHVVVTRYEATCPICAGTIELCNGGNAWPDRIIGACNSSPLEHVFSFDRLTLSGRPLREDMKLSYRHIE